jgi:hypothetical protein
MLQALATVKSIQKLGFELEIIRYKKNLSFIFKVIPKLFTYDFLKGKYKRLQKKISLLFYGKIKQNNKIRNEYFKAFCENKFGNHLSPICNGYKKLCESSLNYSAILSGSDQLWLPSGLSTNFYNLMFVPKDIPKISYASSFGVSKIPLHQRKRTAEFLSRIEYISVREIAGQKIIKELAGKNIPLVCDPTLLLTKEEWKQEIPKKEFFDKPYILAYLLGPNRKHRIAVNELKEKTKLPIIALRHLDQYVAGDENFGDFAPYNVGPEEFINLIRFAEFICTDSFHGTVFSCLHNKQFLTFDRYSSKEAASRNSRIDSLLKTFCLEGRRFNGNIMEIQKEIDWKLTEEKINELRHSSFKFLKGALK